MTPSSQPRRRALIVVDVQNDFCENGSLPVVGGHRVARGIAEHLRTAHGSYDLVAATRDWHLPDHDNGGHVAAAGVEPDFTETWPGHCIQGTLGAAYHPDLAGAADLIDVHLVKGSGAAAFSGFEATTSDRPAPDTPTGHTAPTGPLPLDAVLREHHIDEVVIAGLATDHCVLATALDAMRLGYVTAVRTDLIAGVAEETTRVALRRMADAGVELTGSLPSETSTERND